MKQLFLDDMIGARIKDVIRGYNFVDLIVEHPEHGEQVISILIRSCCKDCDADVTYHIIPKERYEPEPEPPDW